VSPDSQRRISVGSICAPTFSFPLVAAVCSYFVLRDSAKILPRGLFVKLSYRLLRLYYPAPSAAFLTSSVFYKTPLGISTSFPLADLFISVAPLLTP